MVITYSDGILRIVCAKIAQDVGWNSAHESSLEVLAKLTSKYIKQLSTIAQQFAVHCGRKDANFDDLALAFQHFNISLRELQDYVANCEPQTLDIAVPKFPIRNQANRCFNNGTIGHGDDDEEEEEQMEQEEVEESEEGEEQQQQQHIN